MSQPEGGDQHPPHGGEPPSSSSPPALPSPAASNAPSSFASRFLSRQRPAAYARVPSMSIVNEGAEDGDMEDSQDPDISQASRGVPARGLGIDVNRSASIDAGISSPRNDRTPRVSLSLPEHGDGARRSTFSPPSTGGWSGSTRQDETFGDLDTSYAAGKYASRQSLRSVRDSSSPSLYQDSERGLLRKSATASFKDQFDEWTPKHVCNSAKYFKRPMNNWLAITVLTLSLISTFLSGAYLVLALHKPFYARMIGSDKEATLSVSSAAFLTSFFAKIIELSFVAVVVSFLGQALARRAYRKESSRGVTLAEMSMRNWIMAPSTMFIDWHTVKYASPSALGVIAFVATIVAMLYTTAATALVQPQLRFYEWTDTVLQGTVETQFANTLYIQHSCQTPIREPVDSLDPRLESCIQIEHASQSYHNYQRWISDWSAVAQNGSGSSLLEERLPGWALLNDNVTLSAPWIDFEDNDMAGWYEKTKWIVNNVTMAMPHVGVVAAASDPANGIMQPDELNGLGLYTIRASVPAPFVNVVCVQGLSAEDLEPLVYDEWESSEKIDVTTWPNQLGEAIGNYSYPFLRGTEFDDIFKWGPEYGDYNWPPIFPKLPLNHNTLTNDTHGMPWGRDSIYLLGKGSNVSDSNYGLCSLRAGRTPHCSTHYSASSTGGTLTAVCDSSSSWDYNRTMPEAVDGNASFSRDWPNVALNWARAINLNSGLLDSNASMARLFTNLFLTNETSPDDNGNPTLNPKLPSPAEALAVMAADPLIQSSHGSPLSYNSPTGEWNYTWMYNADTPNPPMETQWFNASIRAQEYSSGGTEDYHQAFYPVLVLVFAINLAALIYFCWHRDWYTDFSDPVDLFALAINSPPSEKLAECSCAGGPKGDDKGGGGSGERFKYYWKLGNDGGHVYMESPEIQEMATAGRASGIREGLGKGKFGQTFEMVKETPVVKRVSGSWSRA